MIIRRGDIYYADLRPVVGSEQGGVRPVLIIQNEAGNKYSSTVIIAAITSQMHKAKLPTHVELDSRYCDIAKDSVIPGAHDRQTETERKSLSSGQYDHPPRERGAAHQLRIIKGEITTMSQSGPSGFRKFFSKKVDEDKVEEEILSMVEEGHEQGLIEEGEMELINNIFEFGDKEAKDIMTPRQKIVAVENTQTVEQALQLAVENNFSRYPVYEEDLDNIIGLVHIKDLIAVYMKDPKTPVAGMVDKAIVTHPTKDVSELLQRMQREKIHMAVVVDEYGQTEGIVTMEDILEEIVGNILDEHDEEQPEEIQKQSEDEYLVDGGATLEDLEDLLGIEFPDEDFETVNGFLRYEHGRLPEEGESFKIEYQGYEFIPVKIEDNRIITVKITKLKEEE